MAFSYMLAAPRNAETSVTVDHDQLTILVESGATKYLKGGLGAVDCLIHLPLQGVIPFLDFN
jgi:hypothetical protein